MTLIVVLKKKLMENPEFRRAYTIADADFKRVEKAARPKRRKGSGSNRKSEATKDR